MQTTDEVTQPAQLVGMPHNSLEHTQLNQPSPLTSIYLSNKLKAIGLVALSGVLGLGAILLGRTFWQPGVEETFAPLPEAAGASRSGSSTLRDRIQVITPDNSPVSPPKTLATAQINPNRRSQLRQSPPQPSLRISQGFNGVGQLPLIAAAPVRELALVSSQLPTVKQPTQAAAQSAPKTVRAQATAGHRPYRQPS